MMRQRFKPAYVAAAVLIVGAMTFLWNRTRSVDSVRHEAIVANMRSLATLDHALNEQVLKVRFGLNASYDDVSAAEEGVARLKNQLQLGAFPLSADESRTISDEVQRYAAAQLQKSTLIEEFKSENACLRNSLSFFPVAAERAIALASASRNDDAAALGASVNSLLAHTLSYAIRGESRGDSQARDALESDLAAMATGDAPKDDLQRAVRGAMVHAQSIHDHKARADSILATILSLPTRERADELFVTYSVLHAAASRAGDSYRVVLYITSVALAGYGAWAFVRMGRSARALTRANETLEERVADRTRALEVASRSAEEATRAKSAFLANMSHEIRTPMTAILGYADLMSDPMQSASERLEAGQTIRRNAAHLLALINDILDLSKIEAGKMTVEAVETAPGQVVADVAALMRGRAAEKSLRFDVGYRGAIPRTIRSDPTRLRQILVNLAGNAIKFTQSGGVRLTCSVVVGTHDEFRLRIEVRDTGIGLSPEQQSRLFGAFEQADASTSRKFGGTGLGLNISKRLAMMMGGDITVRSALNEGSTFTLEVPTGRLEGVEMIDPSQEPDQHAARTREEEPAVWLSGVRVLLAEDGPDNQRLLSFILRKAGAEVWLAENGLLAVQMVQEATDRPFDVILMDMQMPEMDGYTAARTLRSQGYSHPIIALTANAMAGDREQCIAAGCDDFATKPIDRKALLEAIAAVAKPRTVPT